MSPNDAQIVSVERLNDGLVVLFKDGTCVYYSAPLLYQTIPQAEIQDERVSTW